ncbi:MATE family efflux transporter [Methanobacterium formicicum]|uniref:MATE efflux family protein n=1 Tax=Methanobacterium formicicum (strain DSM 3637 / PP1) TaxID=1204725 RepID=K2R2W8_METFP|nr:MATE family efflux transporter [Methanobacterium formicicum]EKF85582.1 MATE efflux family protein [Methanobacterium formicicum DSM 3637]
MENKNEKTNSRIEMITGDPKRAIRKLSFPMMLIMILVISYQVVDSIWIAGLGADALAALGFITPLYMIIVGLGQGLGAGSTSLIARSIGKKDHETASNAGMHAILITAVLSIVLPAILLLFLNNILIAMGASLVLNLATEYGQIVFIGSFALLFNLVGSSILRAEGDMKRATYAIALTSILNMIIAPLFIYTLNMGIKGAAVATVLSSTIAAIAIFYWILVKKDTYITFKLEKFHFNMDIIRDILVVTVPASVEQFIMSVLAIGINWILVMVAGTTAVAVYTAGWRIVSFGIIPALAIETGVLTVAGIAYGARNYKNLKISCNYGIKLGVLISIILAAVTYIFAPNIAWLFSYSANSADLTPMIAEFLRIFCVFFIAIPFGLASTAVFQAAGKGTTSLIMVIIRDLIMSLSVAYLLGVILGWGEQGVYWGIVIGVIIGSAISYLYFRLFLRRLDNEKADEVNLANQKKEKISDS